MSSSLPANGTNEAPGGSPPEGTDVAARWPRWEARVVRKYPANMSPLLHTGVLVRLVQQVAAADVLIASAKLLHKLPEVHVRGSGRFQELEQIHQLRVCGVASERFDPDSILGLQLESGRVVVDHENTVEVAPQLGQVLDIAVALPLAEITVQDPCDWQVPLVRDLDRHGKDIVREDHDLKIMTDLPEELVGERPLDNMPTLTAVVLKQQNDLIQVQNECGDVLRIFHGGQFEQPRLLPLRDKPVTDGVEDLPRGIVEVLECIPCGGQSAVDGLPHIAARGVGAAEAQQPKSRSRGNGGSGPRTAPLGVPWPRWRRRAGSLEAASTIVGGEWSR
mmetsp:Transcript_93336/g.268735  ORF Transcript_93336/g.268735 Transcript_93336/m.268735 type:complete len:334 (+) Transcript_93336:183-1184(+)